VVRFLSAPALLLEVLPGKVFEAIFLGVVFLARMRASQQLYIPLFDSAVIIEESCPNFRACQMFAPIKIVRAFTANIIVKQHQLSL